MVADSSRPMVGSATLTMVLSMPTRSTLMLIAPSAHHRVRCALESGSRSATAVPFGSIGGGAATLDDMSTISALHL